MVRSRVIGVSVLVAACVATVIPHSTSVTPMAPDAVYARALTVLTAFGYTITGGTLGEGQVFAERVMMPGSVSTPSAWYTVHVVIVRDSTGQTRYTVRPRLEAARYGTNRRVIIDSLPSFWGAEFDSIVARIGRP